MRIKPIKCTYTDKNDFNTIIGRFIGFINDKQFATILKAPDMKKKICTSESIDIGKIIGTFVNVEGLRIVIVIKQINGKEIEDKKLFISERLSYANEEVTIPEIKWGFLTESFNTVTLQEVAS